MSSPSAPDRNQVAAAVVAGVRDVAAQRQGGEPPAVTESTRLLGRGAVLDSLGLVTLIVDLEERIEQEFGHSVTLASERAMSQASSPFLSVATLTEHICGLLQGADVNGRS
jgi:acyl carrier protein